MTSAKKKAAPNAVNARSGKNDSMDIISSSSPEVKPEWKKNEMQREAGEALKRGSALKAAMYAACPVIAKNTTAGQAVQYQRITAIIYRPHPYGGIRMQVELLDRSGHSVALAAPKNVHIPGDTARPAPEDPADEQRVSQLTARLKDAMKFALAVKSGGREYRRISAIIFRPGESGVRVLVELVTPEAAVVSDIPAEDVEIHDYMWNGHTVCREGEDHV